MNLPVGTIFSTLIDRAVDSNLTFPAVDGSLVSKEWWEWVGITGTIIISVVLFVLYHPWVSLIEPTETQYMGFVVLTAVLILGVGGKAIRKPA